jgi:glucose-6-phosphate dehydrogenase assembly protein OpcA
VAEAVDGLQDIALTWSGRALDVNQIEAELGKLRYLAAGEPAGGLGFAMRTSLMNMVVYTQHDEGAAHASRVIEDLASHHPSRALVVVARPSDDESHIEAQLAAHCHITQEDHNICCEEVMLHVSGRAAAHLHSVIVPLLVPDLPVYVWWAEQLPDDPHLFLELMEAADHMIIDSAQFPHQLDGIEHLAPLTDKHSHPVLGDLNWNRAAPLRELIQRQRQVAVVRHHLSTVKSVEVRYAGDAPDVSAQAVLFVAWLAGELGWDTRTATSAGAEHLAIRHDGRDLDLFIKPLKYPTVDDGTIVSVKVACESQGARALLTVSRTADPHHLTMRTEHMDDVAEDHFRIEPLLPGTLLLRELDRPLRDPEYQRVLLAAVPLIRAARA